MIAGFLLICFVVGLLGIVANIAGGLAKGVGYILKCLAQMLPYLILTAIIIFVAAAIFS